METASRFRHTDSWGEYKSRYPSNHASSGSVVSLSPTKLRLMCSSGGHIVPRPHDKSLRYIGGETRMVVVNRHTTLLDLTRRVSEILPRSSSIASAKASSFTLKYQLPSEDLDSLISLTTDEDLENMIEEYERTSSSSSRLRLFIFPTNPDCSGFVRSVLQNSFKSEEWFVKALNGTEHHSALSDTSPVDWLLNLDDEISLPEKKDVNVTPDSPVMESLSSFGSESSSRSLANLPPIKVITDYQPNHEHHNLNNTGVENNQNPNKPITSNPDPLLSVPDRNARIKIEEQIQTSACLLSIPQIESPRNQLLHKQPQILPILQYTHGHPPGPVPVASYYYHPPMDQRNLGYYVPARPQPRVAAIVSGNQVVLKTEFAGAPQPVMIQSSQQNQPQYAGNIHQTSADQITYYATQAMQPLPTAQYKRMKSISPVDRNQFSRTPVTTAQR